MTATITAADVTPTRNALDERTVCLDVTFHVPGVNRRIKDAEVRSRKNDVTSITDEERANQAWVRANKTIMVSETYAAINEVRRKARQLIESKALPSPLKRGTYRVPLESLEEIYQCLDAAEARFVLLADQVRDEYESVKEAARENLKELYDERDYVDAETFRRAFWVERRLLEFGMPGQSKLGEYLYQRERERWADQAKNEVAEIVQALRESARKVFAHLVQQLSPADDGKRRVLRPEAIEAVIEFADTFQSRNVLGDDALAEMVTKAKGLLEGKTQKDLAKNATLREEIRSQLAEVTETLDSLIETGVARSISFEE